MWSPLPTDINAPALSSLAHAVWTGREMIVMSGIAGAFSVVAYEPGTRSWKPLAARPSTAGGKFGDPVWTGNRIIWHQGGHNDIYDINAGTWSKGSLPSLFWTSHAAVWTGTQFIGWGGRFENGELLPLGFKYE